MRIELGNFYIESDDQNYTLYKIQVKSEKSEDVGGTYDVSLGFYGTLQMALKGYLKHSLRRDTKEIKTVEELLLKINDIENKIDKVISFKSRPNTGK